MTRGGDPVLRQAGLQRDGDIDLALVALHLAALSHPGISLDRYVHHLRKTGSDVGERHAQLVAAGAEDGAATRLAALKHVIADGQGFRGAQEDYDNIDNADLIRVIDRRRGMPIALAILYMDAARRLGWDVSGLNLPGHFILRVDRDGDRLIFDPYNDCKLLQASDLRAIVKLHLGPAAELSATYYEPADNRQILLRMQNNIKMRQIQAEDYAGALATVDSMRLLAPDEYRLLLDTGVLMARLGRHPEAIDALEAYIEKAPTEKDRRDAALLLQHIRNTTR